MLEGMGVSGRGMQGEKIGSFVIIVIASSIKYIF